MATTHGLARRKVDDLAAPPCPNLAGFVEQTTLSVSMTLMAGEIPASNGARGGNRLNNNPYLQLKLSRI
jgi:hypothetical protein